jgi:Uroporphyrinogen decarboxylase (URO-D)
MFLPRGAITGIGSLPHAEPTEAVQFVVEACPELPFWPQLPQRSESERMIEQVLRPCLHLVQRRTDRYGYRIRREVEKELLYCFEQCTPALEIEDAAGFYAFERAIQQGMFRDALALKGQIVGPITLALHLSVEDQTLLADPTAFATLCHYIARLALWQVHRLQVGGIPVMMFLDEPCLPLVPDALARVVIVMLKDVVAIVRASGCLVGLHCCAGQASFDAMHHAAPDILSFDAHQDLVPFLAHAGTQAFLRRGGCAAFGLVPGGLLFQESGPEVLFRRWLSRSEHAHNAYELARQSIITTTCGLGLLSPSPAQQAFHFIQQVGALVRQGIANRYG